MGGSLVKGAVHLAHFELGPGGPSLEGGPREGNQLCCRRGKVGEAKARDACGASKRPLSARLRAAKRRPANGRGMKRSSNVNVTLTCDTSSQRGTNVANHAGARTRQAITP